MSKPFEEAYALIEEITTNNFQWSSERIHPKKVASIQDSEILTILTSQVAAISRKLDHIGIGNQINQTSGEDYT